MQLNIDMNFKLFYEANDRTPIKSRFSEFPHKKSNRDSEFTVLAAHLKALPNEINMLSFPYQYAYEERLISTIPNKRINIFSAEKVDQHDPNPIKTPLEAKRFLARANKSDQYTVWIPSRFQSRAKNQYNQSRTGNKYRPIHTSQFSLLGAKSRIGIIDNAVWNRVDNSPWHVTQTEPIPLPKLDLVDLDYVDAWGPERHDEINRVWNHMNKNGIMIVSLATKSQYWETRARTYDKNRVERYRSSNLIYHKTPPPEVYKTDPSNSYGLDASNTDNQKLFNMIIRDLSRSLGVSPVYVNMYKGGDSSKARIMMRMAFKK